MDRPSSTPDREFAPRLPKAPGGSRRKLEPARHLQFPAHAVDQRTDLHAADRDHVLDHLLDFHDARAVPLESHRRSSSTGSMPG